MSSTPRARAMPWLVGLASLGACTTAPPVTPTPIVVAGPAPASSPMARPRAPTSPCDTLAQLQEEGDSQLPTSLPDVTSPVEMVAAASRCLPFPGGAWGLVSHDGQLECPAPPCEEKPNEAVLSASIDVVLVRTGRAPVRRLAFGLEHGLLVWSSARASTFDYDGDGVPELLVVRSEKVHETPGTREGLVFAAKGAEVVLYGPSQPFEVVGTEDIDGDGRPDLDLGPSYEGDIVPCGMDGIHIEGAVHRFAHSVADGTFSTDDAALQAHFRAACPARPRRIVTRAKGGIDNDALRRDVVCSRLWGVSSQDVFAALARDCRPPGRSVDVCAFEGVVPGCVNIALLQQWAAQTPPITLR